MNHKKTKIVCTLGPATNTIKAISELIKAGMNVARINFSHSDHPTNQKLIENVRAAAYKTKTHIAIMQDLQGPKIRLGKLPEPGVKITKDQKIILSTGAKQYADFVFPVQYKGLHKDVKKGDTILIEDGLIELKVLKVADRNIHCQSVAENVLKSHKGINVPTASISANPLTAKDKKDLELGLKLKVDYVALSFVRQASDIQNIKKIIQEHNSKTKVVAKIERREAVQNLISIIKATDAAMVARGDLGVEIPAEMVPIVQKKIISHAVREGKPVIIATEVLQSMIEKPRATRAEVSDAANGVYDGTDALMLSNETAVGKYPTKAVQTLAKVAHSIEKMIRFNKEPNKHSLQSLNVTDSICRNAADIAQEIGAKCVVAVTHSGYVARLLAKQRIFQELITFCPNNTVRQQLALVWGLNRIYVQKLTHKTFINKVVEQLKKDKLVKKGDEILILFYQNAERRIITTLMI